MAPSKTSKTWFLVVDHDFQAIGNAFMVTSSPQDHVDDLKKKVKKVLEDDEDLPPAQIIPRRIKVWKTKGRKIINKDTSKNVAEILKNIDTSDSDIIEIVGELDRLADLGLSDNQVLLAQLPPVKLSGDNPVRGRITSNLSLEYEDIFLKAHAKGKFTDDDFQLNHVRVEGNKVPKFVQKYEEMLGRKRKVIGEMGAIETIMGPAFFREYFDCSAKKPSGETGTPSGKTQGPSGETQKPSGKTQELSGATQGPSGATQGPSSETQEPSSESSGSFVGRLEVQHAIALTSFEGPMLWALPDNGQRRLFKELDANWLFFFTFAHHCGSLSLNDATPKITVKFGQRSWPFMLVVKVDEVYHTYNPRSDFLVLKLDPPRVAVEVNPYSPDRLPVDHHRVIFQGACIVRFANTFLDAYKKKKDFIFVAIFIDDTGAVIRYLLYQKEEGSQEVYRKRQVFDVQNTIGCLRFALELYNLSSALNDEGEDEDTERRVEGLRSTVDKASEKHELPTFTGKTKGGEDQTEPNIRRKGDDGGANEQLEACGYEVVPDVLETDGGTWELISKLPPYILTVHRRRDPNKTELIAKHVRKGSNEPDILKYLHTIQPQSPHVISFIETIPSIATEWLILPKLHSIGDQLFMNRVGVRNRVQLGWGLIKGLAYLHEHKVAHRDIKPDNLVCDGDFRLQIIDFDVAIKVQDENTEIDKYRGTKNWTAPEMGDEEGPTPMYSPIKADRWSCGRVLLRHIMVRRDKQLSKFADQLTANDPQQRPSLLEWPQWFAALPNVANVHKGGGKESRPWQDMKEIDGESMDPPDAKKPRLAAKRGVQPVLNGLEAS